MPGTQLIRAFLLLLPTAGGGTAICQYFSKARCVLAVHLFSIFLMSPGAEENRRGARGLSVLPISEQYEVRTPLTDNDRRLPIRFHLPKFPPPRDFANGIRRCSYIPDAAHKGSAFSRSRLRANTKIATS
jgi:hypothetical protein